LLPQGLSNVRYANKRYLTGICRELTTKYLESIAFFEEGVGRIEWHARRGHEIVLLTGTLEPLACLAATALECELEARGVSTRLRICATQLEEDGGRWTGRVIGDALFGRAKAHALQKVAEEEGVDLHECHGYGNSLTDRDFLSAVSHPNAVNASREMAAVANQNDWAIWHWHLEKRVDVRPEAEIEPGENESLSAGIQEAGERA
jgi:phosphoserine phosphatase